MQERGNTGAHVIKKPSLSVDDCEKDTADVMPWFLFERRGGFLEQMKNSPY
jgi:hypothetical protein